MDFKAFSLKVIALTSAILLSLMTVARTYSSGNYQMVTALLCVLVLLLCYVLLRTVSTTNTELSRFLEAIRHADYSQRFDMKDTGSGFTELGTTFDHILKQFQAERIDQDEHIKHLKAILDNVPVPLLSVHKDEQITLWNHAARRLFGNYKVHNTHDLTHLNPSFSAILASPGAKEKHLISLNLDGMTLQLSISVSHITTTQGKEMLLAMQDIGTELDNRQQESWQDLVRVLTHEIMNSITPVSSLAKTAADLIKETKTQYASEAGLKDDLADIEDAVTTVAKRSDNLMQFVTSYRKLTRLPVPVKKRLPLQETLAQIITLVQSGTENKYVDFMLSVTPDDLQLNADKEQLEQMFINLLTNALQATKDRPSPVISIQASVNKRNKVVINITDNGTGIPEDVLPNIFVPFFTTRREGSGVGLALTRQIMLAHGGSVQAGNVNASKKQEQTNSKMTGSMDEFPSGAIFTLVF